MTKRTGWALGIGILVVALASALLLSPRVEFMLGGALVNLGYRLQDQLSRFDFDHDESITPDQIWTELERHNELAAGVRGGPDNASGDCRCSGLRP